MIYYLILFRYILKLSEAQFLLRKKHTEPILLLDDFFAKLDDENIMKIFSYFHRKFQAIITTTKIDKAAIQKKINEENKNGIKTIPLDD